MKTRKQNKFLNYNNLRIPIITIPKGTLLFRGVKNINSDFAGIPQSDGTYNLTPYHNVFFYPYPFIADLHRKWYNDLTHYNNSVEVYETLHPIKIVSLVSPSHYTRRNRFKDQFITQCSKLYSNGRSYDPCFTKDFVEKYPEVNGMEAVEMKDGHDFHAALKQGELTTKERSYLHWTTNAKHANSIKEYILYPLKKRYNTIIKDVNVWKEDHKDEFLYRHVISLSRENKNSAIHEFMETNARFIPSTKLWRLKK
jgi:hypothetical protein